jgi:cysteine desulfurase / selenocysteine lyase
MSQSLSPRAHFPVLEQLTYLNTASIGLVPQPVQEQALAFDKDIATRGTTGFDEEAETFALEGARKAAADLFGSDPTSVTVGKAATETFCQVAWSLRPAPGANLVVIDIDHPSTVYPWVRAARESGVEIRMARVWDDPASLSIDLLERLVDDRTWAVAVSQVQYSTGYRLDLRAVTDLAHAHGAVAAIDATQAAGMAPIEVATSGVDVLVAGGYKWLCGMFGASVGYVRPELIERIDPPFAGWRSTPDPYTFDSRDLPLAPGARRLEYSTMSYGAAVGLGGAIEYVLNLGISSVLEHDLALATELMLGLDELEAEVLSSRVPEHMSGIVTARFPGRDGERVATRLNGDGVVVSPRFGATRFALHHFNDSRDVQTALERLRGILNTPDSD